MKRLAVACVWISLAFSIHVGAQGLVVSPGQTDGNGVTWYDATSSHNGPGTTTLRVLPPSSPAAGMPRRFIYVLPVIIDVDLGSQFGDGLEELRALNLHNEYNAHVIAPSFGVTPWHANHASASDRQYESFMVQDLVPWVKANLSTSGQEEHWLLGFSKSGFGAVTLLFRNPTVFDAAAAWDLPADQADTSEFQMLENYGTDANFQSNYRLTSEWIATRAEPFRTATRLWLSQDFVTHEGVPTFRDEVLSFAQRLEDNEVQFTLGGGATRIHTWTSGWLPEAVGGLHAMRYAARDDFDRADGDLGPNWVRDPLWGTGTAIVGGRVTSPLGNGGAHYWNGGVVGADQYSQVTLAGAVEDWAGVVVRGAATPSQGYWVAIKPDGAYLYSYLDGVFHQLAYEPTAWATGDVLRLEVVTAAANTARLTISRNGTVLVTLDDATHFVANGQPGIGLYAATAVALDSWQGGKATLGPQPLRDDFDRADGDLGANWARDPVFGSGTAIAGGQVASSSFDGGAHYWAGGVVGPDQYSQVTLSGAIGDWTGVVVRGGAAPSQGYWVAVKPDGAHLYSYVDGVFSELAHDATVWATGDVLRLEVVTVAGSTARLAVFRNGVALITADDGAHFIANGQPGIGLYAGAAVALDSWEAGRAYPGPQPPRDDFNRADGDLGPNWTRDPSWGTGTTITGGQVSSSPGNGGAHYWNGGVLGPDQFSQITLTGAIGDWMGVVVRGGAAPSQGYWVAIRADGATLYSYVNTVFHQLAHDATVWGTGDVLRLEVVTVAANTSLLTVYRNGAVLLSVADASHFIESGRPGIGLFAGTAVALDSWEGGKASSGPQLPQDGFDRPNGDLGPNWVRDPVFGAGTAIAGGQVVSAPLDGGAHYWNGSVLGADQYSQITLTGAIGDWTGVVVRGGAAPSRGYWVAVKPDGAYLYSYVGGVFHQLAHDPTVWATGDVLRLEVWNVATGTARLTMYRNGAMLITLDDAAHFIASGQPGIGLFAGTAVALDSWEGGTVNPGPPLPRDDFDRADGDLGPNWADDPSWGTGTAITGGQVGATPFGSGAHYWNASVLGADQYSQVTLTGVIGDWAGVVVRGGAAPSQGYWAVIKPDGAYLYSYLGGVFHPLVHDATVWATGDLLRLEVVTVAANTARLTMSRNGNALVTVDDAAYFIGEGQPGIGLYAGTAVALDAWEGGTVPTSP